jgi:NAD(P) transhydrogenase
LAAVSDPFNLVVIGSGPAGEKGAAQAAYFGKRVAIVERQPALGGAAANTGTLPSKTLRETSLTLSGFRNRGLYGVDLSLRRQATIADLMQREAAIVGTERERIATNLDRHHVTVFHGEASFVDAHTVRVSRPGAAPIELGADVVLIATGSSPRRTTVFPFDHPRVFDSDEILTIGDMPRSLLVVGGGVIGAEYASTFAALGVEVSLIEGRDRLLGFLDGEIAAALRRGMENVGIRFFMPRRVSRCDACDESVTLLLDGGVSLGADAVLVSAGRVSNVGGLDLDAAGIRCGEHGIIEVDAHFRTSAPNIYAAGDVIGFPALASTSMEQARLAMVHAFDLQYKKELAPVLPYGIYTIPEVSMAGETEETLTQKGVDYIVGKTNYRNNARGQIVGDPEGMLKLLFAAADMKLLGVHVLGEQATELVHVGLTAMLAGATNELFIRTCYNYPTLAEMYKYATYDAMGKRDAAAALSRS